MSSVRFYEAEGFLPPAARTPSGHRRFTSGHLRALLTARVLRDGYTWTVAREVMRAVHAGNVAAAFALVDGHHATLHAERVRIDTAMRTVAATAPLLDEEVQFGRRVPIGRAADLLDVTPATLRHWERRGVITPGRFANRHRTYTPLDLRRLRQVQILREAGYPFDAIAGLTEELDRGRGEGLTRALAERRRHLTERSRRALAADAALHAYLAVTSGQ